MINFIVGLRRVGASVIAALLLAAFAGRAALAQVPAASSPGSAAAATLDGTQDIREIRGPKPIPSAWLIPLIALCTLASGGAAWAAWKWYRRPGLLLRTPVEIALSRLEYARKLMLPELARDFSIEVSSIVREYIESRFEIRAAHLTTHEFLRDALGSVDPLLSRNRSLLTEFLQSCDLAKFGGWSLSIAEMDTMLQVARRFVVESSETSAAPPAAPHGIKDTSSHTSRAFSDSTTVTPRESYDSLPST